MNSDFIQEDKWWYHWNKTISNTSAGCSESCRWQKHAAAGGLFLLSVWYPWSVSAATIHERFTLFKPLNIFQECFNRLRRSLRILAFSVQILLLLLMSVTRSDSGSSRLEFWGWTESGALITETTITLFHHHHVNTNIYVTSPSCILQQTNLKSKCWWCTFLQTARGSRQTFVLMLMCPKTKSKDCSRVQNLQLESSLESLRVRLEFPSLVWVTSVCTARVSRQCTFFTADILI